MRLLVSIVVAVATTVVAVYAASDFPDETSVASPRSVSVPAFFYPWSPSISLVPAARVLRV